MIELNNINERISYVVQTSGLTKTAFAQRINISQGMVSMLCSGKAAPSDRTISDICREFQINELWLRTGEGSIVHIPTRKEQIAAYMGELLGGQRTEAEELLIATMSNLSEEAIITLNRLIDHIAKEWNKDKIKEYAETRGEAMDEKKHEG